MRNIILTLLTLFIFVSQSYAMTETDARKFFNDYVNKANSYSKDIEFLYAPNAVIIRQVIKPNGELVNVYSNSQVYLKQMKISESVAKARNYKNYYSNISITKVPNGYKISAIRQPSGDKDKLKVYQIIKQQPNGKIQIVEEMMQTRQQVFLKYAK